MRTYPIPKESTAIGSGIRSGVGEPIKKRTLEVWLRRWIIVWHLATTLCGSRCAPPSPRHSILSSNPLFLLHTPDLILFLAVDSLGFGCTAPPSLFVPPLNQIQTQLTILTIGMVRTHSCCSVQLVYSSVLVDCLPIQVDPATNRAEIRST